MCKKYYIPAILALSLFSVFNAVAGGGPPALVKVDNAVTMDIAPAIWVSGTVIGRYDSNISAEVEGRLETILDVGDRVNKGDVIARIDATRYRLAVEEIEAEIPPIETMVGFYTKEAERLEKLAQQNNAARNQLDQTIANRDEAKARIRLVKSRLASARDDLDRTTILSPFTGVITERIKSPGERVEQGDEVVRLVDTGNLEIQAYIQRSSFINLDIGDELKVTSPDGEARATISALIPVGDRESRLFEMRLALTGSGWTAGTAVKVSTPVAKQQSVLAVPRDALVIRQSGTVVYKINGDNTAQMVPVTTGIANTTHIQVFGELQADDRVVIRGNERLQQGATVTVMGGSNS
ncbi:MAG: efflux RND transporter periplasmic adaptor subunit [Gammaproteobacteria bacterium]